MNLDEAIARKQAEHARVQRELDVLLQAKKLMKDMGVVDTDEDKSKKPSQPQMVEDILRERNQPMHVKAIAQALSIRAGKQISSDYVSALIYRDAKRNKRFRKVEGAPNTFGLLEWPKSMTTQPSLNGVGSS
jgi:hypothetical protein